MEAMTTENLIAVSDFCINHKVTVSFIRSLQKTGLIEIVTIKKTGFIDIGQLQLLERIVRLFYELDINLEGIETITYMLQRINTMQDEITSLKNRLRIYEIDE